MVFFTNSCDLKRCGIGSRPKLVAAGQMTESKLHREHGRGGGAGTRPSGARQGPSIISTSDPAS